MESTPLVVEILLSVFLIVSAVGRYRETKHVVFLLAAVLGFVALFTPLPAIVAVLPYVVLLLVIRYVL